MNKVQKWCDNKIREREEDNIDVFSQLQTLSDGLDEKFEQIKVYKERLE